MKVTPAKSTGTTEIFGHVNRGDDPHYWGPIRVNTYENAPQATELRRRRVAARMGLRQLAGLLGISVVELSGIERHELIPESWDDVFALLPSPTVEPGGGEVTPQEMKPLWSCAPCFFCGTEGHVPADEPYVCESCESYGQGYQDGLNHNQAALDALRSGMAVAIELLDSGDAAGGRGELSRALLPVHTDTPTGAAIGGRCAHGIRHPHECRDCIAELPDACPDCGRAWHEHRPENKCGGPSPTDGGSDEE